MLQRLHNGPRPSTAHSSRLTKNQSFREDLPRCYTHARHASGRLAYQWAALRYPTWLHKGPWWSEMCFVLLTFSCTMCQALTWTAYIHLIRTSASSDAHLRQTQSLTLALIESVKSGTGSWQAPHCSDICRNSLPHPPPPTPCMGICQSVSGAQLQQGMWRISPPLCPPPPLPSLPSPPTHSAPERP